MVYSVLFKIFWPRLRLLLFLGLVTSCGQAAVSQSEDSPNNPYAQFRQAVNEVEPLIDPNLESLTTSRLQQEPTANTSSVTLPRDAPLAIQKDVIIASAPTMQAFNEQMYQRLIQAGYGGLLDINVLRAGEAIQQFCQDRSVNFLSVNRAMSEAEIQACQAKGRQPLGLTIGKDPLLLVVNRDNDFVRGIDLEKLKAVLTKDRWSDVDTSWPNTTIERGMIGPNSSTMALLTRTLFPTDGAALLKTANTTFYDYPEPMMQTLSTVPNGLASINQSLYERFTATFRVIPINGISASLDTVESNAYPLVQSLFIYVDQTQLAAGTPTKAVVNFYLTEMAEVMSELGFFPLTQVQLDQTKRQWLDATGSGQ
ncbi:phosphate binding protein [Leptolyngbya sp. Heron Island J]|uniref:PstS family phosphate ABC transporter substrate-binding protein n=1 Tax=Leptolyngbya sp. Heron Island J TaxID=1385935 RepID=UPI0003B96544|nr:substrate-binding domain-containing protein [Leptolyngbya sp. Heron Island J]ESA32805.1 phosphate binding protein [Leptolyngbya sp. Heron Island J]